MKTLDDFDGGKITLNVITSIITLFIFAALIFNCVGKKKAKKQSLKEKKSNDKTQKENNSANEVVVAIEEVTTSEETPLQAEQVNEEIPQYDPTKRQSQDTLVDPYESIEKEVKKDSTLTNLITENSAGGSGNSGNSDNSIYTKVKKVPKKEEIAYAVVDIKDSQDKYETVNGEIVRRQTNDDSKQEGEDLYLYEETNKNENLNESQENSGNSDLYASVKPTDKKENEKEVENEGGRNDAYAVVVKAKPALQSTTAEEQEDSGASGFYAKVGSSASPPSPPTPPPPPPPPHPANMNKSLDKNEISNYEPVNTSDNNFEIERNNTYDSIKEVKMEHKLKKEAAESNSKRHKSKHHKKDDIQQQEKHLASKSPKGSRFSRVNPFKLSKRQKHKHSLESVEFPADETSNHHDDFVDKNNSLPSTARTRQEIIGSAELAKKRHSSPHIPPPLPSVNKLLHLTEHKTRRGSSIDACSSPDSSPRSSPRTPLENSHSSQLSHLMGMSKSSYEEDENYSTVDYTLKSNILQNDFSSTTVLEEEDKYSIIREPNNTSGEFVEDEKYSTIGSTTNTTTTSDISQNEGEKYTIVGDEVKSSILQKEHTDDIIEVEDIRPLEVPCEETPPAAVHNPDDTKDFPDYAVVDLELKRQQRAQREEKSRIEEEKKRSFPSSIPKEITLTTKEQKRFSNSSDYAYVE